MNDGIKFIDSKIPNDYIIEINDPANAFVFITLLMLDQIHDFSEGRETTQDFKISRDDIIKNVKAIVTRTKDFIDNFRTDDESVLQSIIFFIEKNEDWKQIYNEIYGEDVNKLISENKYKFANQLVTMLGIRKINFEDMTEIFSGPDSIIPSFGCSDINNTFYQYLLYSGFIDNKGIPDNLRLVIDAHGSRYDISPILYNICEFILGADDYGIDDVKVIKSIATLYDKAGTSGAEAYIHKLEGKKKNREKKLKQVFKTEREKYIELLKTIRNSTNSTNQRDRRRMEARSGEIRYKLNEVLEEIKHSDSKSISIDNIHSLEIDNIENTKRDSIKKNYIIKYGSFTLIDYSLILKNYTRIIEINSTADAIDIFDNLNKKRTGEILRKFLEKLYNEYYPNEENAPSTNSDILKKINEKVGKTDKISINISFLDNISHKKFIDSEWNSFIDQIKKSIKPNAIAKYKYLQDLEPIVKNLKAKLGYIENDKDLDEQLSQLKYLPEVRKTFKDSYLIIRTEFTKLLEQVELKYKSNIDNFSNFIGLLVRTKRNTVSDPVEIVIPEIRTWLGYASMKKGKIFGYRGAWSRSVDNLCREGSGDQSVISDDYIKSGMSQGYIVKKITELKKNKELNHDDFVYYYPFKTIGDLSQIQECFHNSNSISTQYSINRGVYIFITFDRIAGYISSLFNRTILEEIGDNALFNLNTFMYSGSDEKYLSKYKKHYDNIMRGDYSFSDGNLIIHDYVNSDDYYEEYKNARILVETANIKRRRSSSSISTNLSKKPALYDMNSSPSRTPPSSPRKISSSSNTGFGYTLKRSFNQKLIKKRLPLKNKKQ
jgi:hypothetical protein